MICFELNVFSGFKKLCTVLSLAGSCHKYHVCRDKHTSVTTKLLLKQKMILVAAPANDSLASHKTDGTHQRQMMAHTRDKWWHRPQLVDLSFKNCGVSNVEKEPQECMISILSIVLQETGETGVNFNLYTNQKSWLLLNISIILLLFYVPLQSRFWNDTIDLFFKNCEVSNVEKETQERKYSAWYQYWVLYFKKLARQWWILTSTPIRSPDYFSTYRLSCYCSMFHCKVGFGMIQ